MHKGEIEMKDINPCDLNATIFYMLIAKPKISMEELRGVRHRIQCDTDYYVDITRDTIYYVSNLYGDFDVVKGVIVRKQERINRYNKEYFNDVYRRLVDKDIMKALKKAWKIPEGKEYREMKEENVFVCEVQTRLDKDDLKDAKIVIGEEVVGRVM